MTPDRILATIAEKLQITRPLVVVDVETTGKVPGVDRIVQIGIMKVKPRCPKCGGYGAYEAGDPPVEKLCEKCFDNPQLGEGEVTQWWSYVDPQMPIPAEATLAHKITNDMIAGAPTWSSLAKKIALGMSDCDFVGQNVRFDLRFIEAECARVGVRWGYADACIIDTLRIDQVKDPRDLTTLLKKYCDETLTDAHDAMADVCGTVKVLAGELRAYPDLPSTVAELHALLFPRDASWVDAVGKIVWRNQDACIGFGKWNGTPLRSVPKDYLAWMNGSNFSDDVKKIVRDALDNKFPVRAAVEATA